jgi:hypothetical protein
MRVEEPGSKRGCSDPKYCQNVKPKPPEHGDQKGKEASHEYTKSNIICPAAFACSQEQLVDALSRFAFPGQDPSQPIINGNDYYVTPFDEFENYPNIQVKGHIQVIVRNGGLTSINSTLPGHIFYNGVVERTLTQESDGAWRVTTHGYGKNTNVETALVNQIAGPQIFQDGALLLTPAQLIP